MTKAGSYQFPPTDAVIYSKPAAEALREEGERLGAKRVYLIASRTLRLGITVSKASHNLPASCTI